VTSVVSTTISEGLLLPCDPGRVAGSGPSQNNPADDYPHVVVPAQLEHTLKRNRFSLLGLLALSATLLFAAACNEDDPITDTAAAAGNAEITITAHDYSFDAPDSIPSGAVSFTLRNEGHEPHHAMFVKLNEGVSTDEVMAAFQEGPDAALPLVSFAGGTGTAEHGGEAKVILEMTPGQYLMLCMISGGDDIPHAAKGMVKPFTVTGEVSTFLPPRADAEVLLRDFSFEMPDLTAGEQTVKVSNTGHHPHEFILFRLLPGKSLADFQAFMEDESGPPPFEEAGGLPPIAGGTSGWITLELTPGDYVAICFIPEPASGQPHFALGMIKSFTVE
jgi:hypothetical protein